MLGGRPQRSPDSGIEEEIGQISTVIRKASESNFRLKLPLVKGNISEIPALI